MTMNNLLLSEAIGDIAGSSYEFCSQKNIDKVQLFAPKSTYTDDTVCTFAVAEALMDGQPVKDRLAYRCQRDLMRGYGGKFNRWIIDPKRHPYNSYGNGSAMRCSAAGFLARNEEECERMAKETALCTHNHPEGIKGAVATALAIFYLMQGHDKAYIHEHVLTRFYPEYKDSTYAEMQPGYTFSETCQLTVPACLVCFLESSSYEHCLKLCIAMGGDADTMGAIAGPMAYAYYREMPAALVEKAREMLPEWMKEVGNRFDALVALKDKPRYTPERISELAPGEIFVFGSNLQGAHAGGAAKMAVEKFGAVWGLGVGLQGRCYAIPTMQGDVDTIKPYVDQFLTFAKTHTNNTFLVTRIGCGIAGFKDEEIAPLFEAALQEPIGNVVLPRSFVKVIQSKK